MDPASPKRLRIEEELSSEGIPVEEEERLSKWEEIWYRTTHIFREKKYLIVTYFPRRSLFPYGSYEKSFGRYAKSSKEFSKPDNWKGAKTEL